MADKTATATRVDGGEGARRVQHQSPPPIEAGLASTILDLQRTAGNQHVGSLLGGALLQRKLRIGPSEDAYEREAEAIADAVLGMSDGAAGTPALISAVHKAGVQRMCAECEEKELEEDDGDGLIQRQCDCGDDERDLVQAKTVDGKRAVASDRFADRLAALRGSGRPIPMEVRTFFEPRFAHDFGAVRVHSGANASAAARSVNARAFTVGSDIVFGTGEWSPETKAGRRLLAHELTHVVQQTPLVARRKPLLQRASLEGSETSPIAEGPAASAQAVDEGPEEVEEVGGPETSGPAIEAGAEFPVLGAAAPIVEDDAETVDPGQMKRSEFFARLRPEMFAAAEAGLAGSQYEDQGSSQVESFLVSYEGRSVEHINRDLSQIAEEGSRPSTAAEYVPLIAARFRTSIGVWARTGQITGVPDGLEPPGAGASLLGVLSGPTALFKARPGGTKDPGDTTAITRALGSGRPLNGTLRSRMESAFGQGLSHVRIHTDGKAAELSNRFNARAFTVGKHVAFGAQEYRPGTLVGDALIAHEMAHVVQQGGATEGPLPLAKGADYGKLEADADRSAVGVVLALWGGAKSTVAGLTKASMPSLRSTLRLQRCSGCGQSQQSAPPVAQSAPGAATSGGQGTSAQEATTSTGAGGTGPASPCGGSSLASSYTPTDQGITATPSANDFGNTSRGRAETRFGACKVGNDWRFHLTALTVRVASEVQPVNFRTNVTAATDAIVTQATHGAIMADVRPNRSATFNHTCGGAPNSETISNYSRRRTYWNHQFVVDHEAFHRSDWDSKYRPELVQAENQTWQHTLPVASAATPPAAVQHETAALRAFFADAYTRGCATYAPQKEERAYTNGAPQYQQLTDDIQTRATKEKW